jgi:thymidylate synthase
MRSIVNDTFAGLYREMLDYIYNDPEYETAPRGLRIREATNFEIILRDPLSNLFYNPHRSPKFKYLYPELLWYFSGRNDLEFISRYSKFWNNIANEDGTVNSAYGYLLFNQKNKYAFTEYQWAYESLAKDKDSRQAILRFNKPEHSCLGNKDFVCTLNGIFHIRDNELNFTTTMRSQDVWFGIIYDIPFYTLLMQQMRNHLITIYPDLKLGTYVHYVMSEHIYEKDFHNVEEMLMREFIPASTPQLKADLIHTDGSPTDLLRSALKAVETNSEYTDFGDELINTMVEYSLREEPNA